MGCADSRRRNRGLGSSSRAIAERPRWETVHNEVNPIALELECGRVASLGVEFDAVLLLAGG